MDKPFRFKQFEVSHSRSSIKVGVDGVLVGAFAATDSHSPRRILDVGCGCGMIALMMAQEFPEAQVDAIDIDSASIEEATENFDASPWGDRLRAMNTDINSWPARYDLIVSNPPFFSAGVDSPKSSRERARHADTLSPQRLIDLGPRLLNPGGRLYMIAPAEFESDLEVRIRGNGLIYEEKILIQGNPNVAPKRILLKIFNPDTTHGITPNTPNPDTRLMIIEEARGCHTHEYMEFTKKFYLKF